VVAYPVPGSTTFVDADGRAVLMPDPTSTDRAVTLIERGGETIAALVHDAALAEEQTLVRSVAAAARMALDNERLQAEVRAQLEDVRASRARIVTAGDAERRRIERDLHDGAQQRLVTMALALQMARRVGGETPELTSLLDRAGQELESALSELRELARGVHPPLLVEGGLGPAVEALAERAPLPVEVTVDAAVGRPAPSIEAAAFFVVSESLANVAKHASANRAWVRITGDRATLRVEIRDDGVGGADARRGSGLVGLGDRVAAVGGRFEVASPPGGGTTITAVLPCA
ncbi:MAG: sensor histidine kinase, partial [Candidatus Limnocylindrales bacterium]